MAIGKDTRIMLSRLFQPKYGLPGIEAGHFKVTYRNVPALKSPFDYVIYQMIIFDVKPDLIIEIGTRAGGSALYLADLLEISGKGMLHTIDLPTNQEDTLLHSHSRIRIFKEGFQQYDVSGLDQYKNVLVIDDGSHHYEDCIASLIKFAPFVTTGSYFIMEDGIIDKLGRRSEFHGGPLRAIKEFLQSSKRFTIDQGRCDMFGKGATFNINGYLKCIGS
jgi:cephalosporin hydroxylase